MVKNSPANAGDLRDSGSIPGSGRSPGGGHGNPLQYSCLENPKDTSLLNSHLVAPGFPGGPSGKEPACQCRRHKRCKFDPCIGKIPWRRAWQPTPIFLPEESHGQKSLSSYSPWDCKESDMTEATYHAFMQLI